MLLGGGAMLEADEDGEVPGSPLLGKIGTTRIMGGRSSPSPVLDEEFPGDRAMESVLEVSALEFLGSVYVIVVGPSKRSSFRKTSVRKKGIFTVWNRRAQRTSVVS